MPLDIALDLLDQALTALTQARGSDLSGEEIAIATAVVGRLAAAVGALNREPKSTHEFDDFIADHPELSP
jgi:hypothetical protein